MNKCWAEGVNKGYEVLSYDETEQCRRRMGALTRNLKGGLEHGWHGWSFESNTRPQRDTERGRGKFWILTFELVRSLQFTVYKFRL